MINNFHMILVFILCVDMSWEVFFFTAVYKKVSFAIVFVLFCFDGCNDSYSYEIYIKGKNRRKKNYYKCIQKLLFVTYTWRALFRAFHQ